MKAKQILSNLDRVFGILFLYLLILLVVMDVSIRALSLQPFIGTIEVVRCCLVWSVFISLRYTTREGGHIRMDDILSRFPRKVQTVFELVWYVAAVGVFGVVSVSSVIATIRNRYGATESLAIPFWIFFLPTIIGFILVTLQYVAILVRRIKDLKTD